MIEIKIFGPTVVAGNGARLTASDLGGSKPRQVLEMLAMDLGTPVPKDLLAERLWAGRPPRSYIATVESYVCALRRRLGLVGGRRGPLATSHHGYLLDPEHVQVDAVGVRSLLAGDDQDVVRAVDLIGGTLLADEPYADWATDARDGFDDLLATTCWQAAASANDRKDSALAVRLAREATNRAYLSEPATRELMRALDGVGARTNALQAYDRLRAGMLEDLGVEPERATEALYLSILRAGATGGADGSARDEVHTLLQLLRRALESDPTVLVGLPSMREVGQLLLARAG
jgi:DNA-binding SARP family transcriptional activator